MPNDEYQNQNNVLMRYNNNLRLPDKDINKIAFTDKYEEEQKMYEFDERQLQIINENRMMNQQKGKKKCEIQEDTP